MDHQKPENHLVNLSLTTRRDSSLRFSIEPILQLHNIDRLVKYCSLKLLSFLKKW